MKKFLNEIKQTVLSNTSDTNSIAFEDKIALRKKIDLDKNALFKNYRIKINKGKRIVLIRPPFLSLDSGPPIGLAYVQDILKRNGHHVIVWDINQDLVEFQGLNNFTRDYVIANNHPAIARTYDKLKFYCDEILSLKPDIVGFSLSYPTAEFGIEMAKHISEHVRCIVGGPQASFNEQNLLDLGYFDTVVSGYGEEGALLAVEKSGIIKQRLDKDKEYFPDYEGIEIDKYDGHLPIVTTRGCPNRCNYCTQSHPYYYHTIESVVNQLRNTKGIKKIMYNDSNINVNSKRVEKLFSELSKLKNKPDAHVFGMQVKNGFEKYVSKMVDAGVKEVRLGLESGSRRERASMNKPDFTNDMVIAIMKELTQNKIMTWGQFIFCYPDATEEDLNQTLDLMHRINNECNSKYVKLFWYKFVTHLGTEQFFRDTYGVISLSPENWENENYNSEKIAKLKQKYSKLIPSNAKICI